MTTALTLPRLTRGHKSKIFPHNRKYSQQVNEPTRKQRITPMNYLDILKKYDKAIVTESKKLHGIYERLLMEGDGDDTPDNEDTKSVKDTKPQGECEDIEECNSFEPADEAEEEGGENSEDEKAADKARSDPSQKSKDGMLTRAQFYGEKGGKTQLSEEDPTEEVDEDDQVAEFFGDDIAPEPEDVDSAKNEDEKVSGDEDGISEADTSKLAMRAPELFAEDDDSETPDNDEDDSEEDDSDDSDSDSESEEDEPSEDDAESDDVDDAEEDTGDEVEDDAEDVDDSEDEAEDKPKKGGKKAKKVKGEAETFKNAKEWLASEEETTNRPDEGCKKPNTESEKKSITQIMEKEACVDGLDNEDGDI